MCDTFAFRQFQGEKSHTYFGKNSDREPNEAHEVIFVKGAKFAGDERVQCTYIDIPQTSKTFDVLLCKPVWMWGAEMGVNEHGVIIGNEAVFTKGKQPKVPALTGMDLLRLGLERSINAKVALNCMTGLLETYGQGGNCGYKHPFYYNNSFLIADRKETWVLETVGKKWVARRYVNQAAISNALTLGSDWDIAERGVIKGFDFSREYSDWLFTKFSDSKARNKCVVAKLNDIKPENSVKEIFSILRAHGDFDDIPTDSLIANTVCMHAGFGPIRINQTTGSMVVDMDEKSINVWFTGTSSPCLSIYQPIIFDNLNENTILSSEQDWHRHEVFHRQALFVREEILEDYRNERDKLESEFITKINSTSNNVLLEEENLLLSCGKRKADFLTEWLGKVPIAPKSQTSFLYQKAWETYNKKSGLPISYH